MSGGADEIEESEYDKRIAQISAAKWADFKKTYQPLEGEFKERVMDLGKGFTSDRLAGDAAQSVSQAIGAERVAGQPGGGRFLMNLRGREIGRAAGVGGAVSSSQVQSRARYMSGLENIIAMGRGIENTGMDGLTLQAGIDAQRQYGRAVADSIRSDGVYDAIGTGIGYGAYQYGMREPGGQPPPDGDGRPPNTEDMSIDPGY